MNNFSRGIRNAFRNGIRTISIVLILALAIGLALAMLVARQAVDKKISEVKSSIGNNITISPAGQSGIGGGFRGGANESSSSTLTNEDVTNIESVDHVASVAATLTARVSTDDTNLTSPIQSMGRGGSGASSADSSSTSSTSSSTTSEQSFLMPISVTGTSDVSSAIESLGNASLSEGTTIDGSSTDYVAVIGDQIAEENNLSVGSTFTMYGQTITVKGIIASTDTTSTGSSSSSDRPTMGRSLSVGLAIVLPLKTLQTISGETDNISSISATVDDVTNSESVATAITSKLGTDDDGNNRADVTSDESSAETAIESLASIKTTSTFSLVACATAAAVIILLSMLMIVRERRNEIGALKAIGAKSSTIVKQFAVESLTLTMMAAVIGLGIGILASNPLTSALVSSSSSSSTSQTSSNSGGPGGGAPSGGQMGGGPGQAISEGINNVRDITAQLDWTIVLNGLGAAVLIALVGATTASLIVMRVRPAEAVRAE